MTAERKVLLNLILHCFWLRGLWSVSWDLRELHGLVGDVVLNDSFEVWLDEVLVLGFPYSTSVAKRREDS